MLLAEVLSLHFFRPFLLASEEPLGRARVEGSEIYSDTFWAAGRPEAGLVPGCWGVGNTQGGKVACTRPAGAFAAGQGHL